jgi:UPF0755 protein
MTNARRKSLSSWVLGLLGAAVIFGGGMWWGYNRWFLTPWLSSPMCIDISPTTPAPERLQRVMDQLEGVDRASNLKTFLSLRGWEHRLKVGRYCFHPDESVRASATRMVTADREAVRVVVRSGRDLGPIAGTMTRRLFADSSAMIELLGQDSILWRILPNTYELWWETDESGLIQRLIREHNAWWTEERHASARALGLTPREVTILASIVQAETAALSEAPMVAGLYLNRLKLGMALQADPTLIFALNDPNIRRVLDVHKEVESPYNTYKYKGLPPGPIRVVDPRYIQSVLHPAQHDHLYMCAEPGGDGTHRFATTYREHLRNARAYQRWLNQQRIFR